MNARYTKLADDSWGIRADWPLSPGETVMVEKLSGDTKTEVVGELRGTSGVYTLATITASKPVAQVEDEGVYVLGDTIVKMKRSKAKRLYAMRLREIGGQRATEAGERVHYDWEYAPELTGQVTADHRMSLEQAKYYGIRYGRCLRCGRGLKDAESVERAIGPVCIKFFSGFMAQKKSA